MNEYYVYSHRLDGEEHPFYIGKGKGNRAYDIKFRSKFWQRKAKNGFIVEFLATNLPEKEALLLEVELIRNFGRRDNGTGCLVNHTDGGDGLINPSDETRRKIGEANKQRFTDQAFREKFSEAQRKKVITPETRLKMSAGQSVRYSNQEERDKMRKLALNTWTDEKKKEQSDAKIKFYKDRADVRQRISDTMKNIKCTNTYTLISPDGKEYECRYQSDFAKEHNLNPTCLNNLLKNRKKSHKGWKMKDG